MTDPQRQAALQEAFRILLYNMPEGGRIVAGHRQGKPEVRYTDGAGHRTIYRQGRS